MLLKLHGIRASGHKTHFLCQAAYFMLLERTSFTDNSSVTQESVVYYRNCKLQTFHELGAGILTYKSLKAYLCD